MSPRIALVTLITGEIPTGVLHSVRGQARVGKAMGFPLDYFIVNREREGVEGALTLARFDSWLGPASDRWLKARRSRSVSRLESYDVVLLRYSTGLDIDPTALFRNSKRKLATIHHTKELEEHLSKGLRPSALVRWGFERINGRRILNRAHGVVGVTDEIRDYELARASSPKPAITVTNGVDVSGVTATGFVPFDGRSLRLLLIASNPTPWHGVDRLIDSFRPYRGAVSVVIDVVGNQGRLPGTTERFERTAVHFHGTLRGPALDAIAAQSTLAVATLGLHRKRLRQACSLKTREYLARGLPIVLGYEDVDLAGDLDFALRVPSSEAPLAPDRLFDFAARMSRERDLAARIRAFASEQLDWSHKLGRLVEFGRSL